MGEDLPIHDKAAALASTGGDAELAEILLETCVEETPKLIQEAREAVTKNDFVTARRCGHSLKSSFGVIGALDAAAESEKLEFSQSDDADVIRKAIDVVDQAYKKLTDQIVP